MERILDIGCGRGEIVMECASVNKGAIGIDYSIAAVTFSKKHIYDSSILRGSATHLPFKNEVFDKIVMLEIFNHLDDKDLQVCFRESKRVLKKEGKILIHTPNKWNDLFYLLAVAYQFVFHHRKLPLRNQHYSACVVN